MFFQVYRMIIEYVFEPNLRDLSMHAKQCALGRVNTNVCREMPFLMEMLLPDFISLAEEW